MSHFANHTAQGPRLSDYIIGALTTALVIALGFLSLAQFTA